MRKLFSQISDIAQYIYIYITSPLKPTSWRNPPLWQKNEGKSNQEVFRIYSDPKYTDRVDARQAKARELLKEVEATGNEPIPVPKHNVLGESTGYDKRWVTESTAILPPGDLEMFQDYRRVVVYRTTLRYKRLYSIIKENPDDLNDQLFNLVQDFYRINAFEKELLFGGGKVYDFYVGEAPELGKGADFFIELLQAQFKDQFETHTEVYLALYKAYEDVNYEAFELSEVLDGEGLAIEPNPETVEAVVNEAAQSPYGFWTFMALLGVGVAVTVLCGRSLNITELINEIKDL